MSQIRYYFRGSSLQSLHFSVIIIISPLPSALVWSYATAHFFPVSPTFPPSPSVFFILCLLYTPLTLGFQNHSQPWKNGDHLFFFLNHPDSDLWVRSGLLARRTPSNWERDHRWAFLSCPFGSLFSRIFSSAFTFMSSVSLIGLYPLWGKEGREKGSHNFWGSTLFHWFLKVRFLHAAFYRWKNWGLKKLSDIPKDNEPAHSWKGVTACSSPHVPTIFLALSGCSWPPLTHWAPQPQSEIRQGRERLSSCCCH